MWVEIVKPIAGKDFSYAPKDKVNLVKARADNYIALGVATAIEDKGEGEEVVDDD